MKAITLTQPWASLVALGAKKIETRSWPTKYRGPLAIHAGAGPGSLGWMQMQHLCRNVEPFKSTLAHLLNDRHPADVLPLGAIVATCELVDCVQTWPRWAAVEPWFTATQGGQYWHVPPAEGGRERAFGDYTPGRYAWLLADVRPLATPIPARGALGLWNWNELPAVGVAR